MRERVIRLLEQAYASNNLELADYEARLQAAHRARTVEELKRIVDDFPEGQQRLDQELVAAGGEQVGEPAAGRQAFLTLIGDRHLSAEEMRGSELNVVSLIGDSVLDFRGLPADRELIAVRSFSLIGDTRIILPRGARLRRRFFTLIGDLTRPKAPASASPAAGAQGTRRPLTVVLTGFKLIGDLLVEEE